MTVLLRNNAETVLATALGSSDLGMTVVQGGMFPEPAASEYFYATITAPTGLFEIVQVTARSGNAMTIVRAREGTAALDFIAGSRVELRITAQAITDAIGDSAFASGAYFAADGSGTSVGLNVGAGKILNVDGTLDAAGGTFILPQNTVTAQTAEGSVLWDTNDELLTVGTGSGRRTLVDTVASQTLSGKTLTSPTVNGGTINNAAIGTTTSAAGSFTTLNANGAVNFLPLGVIVMWSGAVADIPTGWALCDGSNNTPDLRNRFVIGAGDAYAVDLTGGSANAIVVSHTHPATSSVTDPGHKHTITRTGVTMDNPNVSGATGIYPYDISAGGASSDAGVVSRETGITVSTTVSTAGVSGTGENLPPYYALAYIMRSV